MEAVIHLKGQSADVVKLARLILRAAKLFRTQVGLGSKSKDDWQVIFEKQYLPSGRRSRLAAFGCGRTGSSSNERGTRTAVAR